MNQLLRLVIDTSSLISYALTKGQIMHSILSAWTNEEIVVLFSPQTRHELLTVLSRAPIRNKAGSAYQWFQENLDKITTFVPGSLTLSGVGRNPKDEPFLACATEGNAHYLVTSDKDLLALKQYEGICILNPGQFWVALALHQTSIGDISRHYSRETLQTLINTVCLEPATRQKINECLPTATRSGRN